MKSRFVVSHSSLNFIHIIHGVDIVEDDDNIVYPDFTRSDDDNIVYPDFDRDSEIVYPDAYTDD